MQVAILVLVVIGIMLAIASGVWVAIALVSAVSTRRNAPAEQPKVDDKSDDD